MTVYRSDFGDFGLIGLQPLGGDVDGSLNISVTNEAARRTGKPMLFTNTESATNRAGLRRVTRVHQDDAHPGLCCLVGNELAQLVEGPAAHPAAMVPAVLVGSLSEGGGRMRHLISFVAIGCLALLDMLAFMCLIQAGRSIQFSFGWSTALTICTLIPIFYYMTERSRG